MKRETICMLAAIAFALMLWCILAKAVGEINELRDNVAGLKQAAIDHGYATYDAKTGAWMWKDQRTKEPSDE